MLRSNVRLIPLCLDVRRGALDEFKFLAADSVLAWPLLAPPGLPAERIGELRAAFDAMMKDPELIAQASRQNLEVAPVSGSELQALVDRLLCVAADRDRSRAQDHRCPVTPWPVATGAFSRLAPIVRPSHIRYQQNAAFEQEAQRGRYHVA